MAIDKLFPEILFVHYYLTALFSQLFVYNSTNTPFPQTVLIPENVRFCVLFAQIFLYLVQKLILI